MHVVKSSTFAGKRSQWGISPVSGLSEKSNYRGLAISSIEYTFMRQRTVRLGDQQDTPLVLLGFPASIGVKFTFKL